MEKSPPGISTIPGGEIEEAGRLFSAVGRNVDGDTCKPPADSPIATWMSQQEAATHINAMKRAILFMVTTCRYL
jgi:hypothetical protein